MSKQHRSFISERTLEYLIAESMRNILQGHYEDVVPFFYSDTREGNKTSGMLNQDLSRFVLLAVFARRGKIAASGDLKFKVNMTLLRYMKDGDEFPILLGLSEATKLDELYRRRVRYYKVSEAVDSEFEFRLSDVDSNVAEMKTENLLALLEIAASYSWAAACQIISSKKHLLMHESSRFGAPYRPLFFVLRKSNPNVR